MEADVHPARAPSRRERVRSATVREIKATARRLLVEHGDDGLTLRAIAREMGMTAPALYRYFPSRESLVEHLVADLYEEVTGAVEAAGRDGGAGGPALLAASRAFRQWALVHPREFGLLFGSPMGTVGEGEPGEPPTGPAHEASQQFGRYFGRLVADLYRERPFAVADDAELPPGLGERLREWCDDLPADVPLGVLQAFLACWIRLYGVVCLEAFGHLRFAVDDAEAVFETELRALSGMLGAADLYRAPAPTG